MSDQHTHDALVLVATRAPFEVRKFPTISPKGDEITVNVKWTASTPLDLHQADGGLLVEHPMRTGSTGAGVVVEIGPDVKSFQVGDRVFGFAHQKPEWKTHQEYSTSPEWVWGKIPEGFSFEEAVTLPENLVTAFNTLWADLKLPVPWPKPADYQPPPRQARSRILVWGAASSVGQLTIQVLRHYGYSRVVATASARHHAYVRGLGASEVYDYRSPTVVEDLLRSARQGGVDGDGGPAYPLIVDCIGSREGTLAPLSRVAQPGSTVAVMLPVILRHSTGAEAPAYSMDAGASAAWAPGVSVSGVRTHFYTRNEMFREKLQTEIMPALLAQGVVKPNRYRIAAGKTLLERATNGLDAMREGASGEKVIWRVANE
ncbi:putative zinc-binding dehydrogenase protein [Rosellinia necatrix]|uniref:Putative zinc-binding dehydrogenase protein n=1 Tax=Rosellinia necatrix TaxID=77044 RepID=A0A1W2TRM5_ROSNE|nr:putative zinc-binding dehydrogenase protein [Rosellinia necatrix]